jgi:methyl halide transferase
MLSKKYWNNRYLNNEIGWDIGEVSEPIKNWFNYQSDKSKKILIPGAGSGHEVGYAYSIGFENIYYLDFSTLAANKFKATYPKFPTSQIISGDFFTLLNYSGFFDIIIEQTFFCAISPGRREEYTNKTYDILGNNGTIIGLLFDKNFNKESPPYGGTKKDYELLFSTNFNILKLEPCYNSILSRKDNELWISMGKRK